MPIAWGIQCGNAVVWAPAPDKVFNGGDLAVEGIVNGQETVFAVISADFSQAVRFTVPVGVTLTLVAEPATKERVGGGGGGGCGTKISC